MATPRGLMGVGIPAQAAKRLGTPSSAGEANLNGGASFAAAAAIGQFQFYVRLNAINGAFVAQLPSNAEIGSEYLIFNIGTTGGAVYPPLGGTVNVNAGATATLAAIATGKGAMFVAVTASTFDAFLSG